MPRKTYGSYKKEVCPYCGGRATAMNDIGIPVCRNHVKTDSLEIKCTCGSWLDIKQGKYGTFFLCDNCGPVSFNKAMSMKEMTSDGKSAESEEKSVETEIKEEKKTTYDKENNAPKEYNISTNDVEYFT